MPQLPRHVSSDHARHQTHMAQKPRLEAHAGPRLPLSEPAHCQAPAHPHGSQEGQPGSQGGPRPPLGHGTKPAPKHNGRNSARESGQGAGVPTW